MRYLLIEWKHFDKNGRTCQRCSQTGSNLNGVLKDLQEEFSSKGLNIELKETKLPERRMAESNSILIEGIPLENLLPDTKIGENSCQSCSDLIDKPTRCRCRTINLGKDIFEEVPVDLIRQAIFKRIRL